jgi:hypothetical protein
MMAGEIPDDLEGIVEYLGFDGSDVDDLLDGDVIQLDEDLEEGSDKQMAVGVAVLLPTTLAKTAAFLRGDRSFEIGDTDVAYQRLSDPPVAADFAGIRFTRTESDEVEELLEVEPGATFNLSSARIRQFGRLGRHMRGRNPEKDATVREAAAVGLREMLLDRCTAYRTGGVQAIEAYDRGDGVRVSPGAELAMALSEDLAQDARLASLVGGFQQAVVRYPTAPPKGVESDFYWIKTQVADRPCFILTHRMFASNHRVALVAERQIYVGHSYNSLLVVIAAIPTPQGILLYYRNRVFTDQVAGRIGSAKKVIGRRRQRNAVVDYLEAIRATFE